MILKVLTYSSFPKLSITRSTAKHRKRIQCVYITRGYISVYRLKCLYIFVLLYHYAAQSIKVFIDG